MNAIVHQLQFEFQLTKAGCAMTEITRNATKSTRRTHEELKVAMKKAERVPSSCS